MAALMCARRIISMSNTNNLLLRATGRRNSGFYVLLPEIGEDLPQKKNPLLKDETTLPEFNGVSIEKCIMATGKQTLEFEQGIRAIEKDIEESENLNIFKNVLEPIEKLEMPLQTTWGISKVLYFGNQSLMPTNSYLNIHKRAWVSVFTKFNSKIIYDACKKANSETKDMTDEEKRILSKYILEGKLNGLELKQKDRGYYDYLQKQIYVKTDEFRKKLQFVNNRFKHKIVDPNRMKGFPEEFLKSIAVDPDQYEEGPWLITLKPGVYDTFMEYSSDSASRWNLWQAKVLRCSMHGEHEYETSSLVNGITKFRCDLAKVLGFKDFSEMSMNTKMAGKLDNVDLFLGTLRNAAYPSQVEELNQLTTFAQERGFDGKLQQWDIPYWVRKQKKSLYNYDEEILQQYFPLPSVMKGLFQVVKDVFNVEVVEREKVDVWHRDVRFFDVYDLDISSSEPAGSFYFDPYARIEDKHTVNRNDGWVLLIRNRSNVCGYKPLSSLIFNFQPPNKLGTPSMLTFKAVRSLFENFGHVLQQLLTRTKSSEVAGLSNVEWDAMSTSKYVIANWAYEPEVLRAISRHSETGEALDDEAIENLRGARTHMAGYNLCWELYLCRFDLDLHSLPRSWEYVMKKNWKEHFVLPEDKKDSHICSWSEIFIDNLGAAYYSDLWSKMLAADVYSAFQEAPNGDKEQQRQIGKRYKDTFMALGGSVHSYEIFRRFRGRDPSMQALIKSLNLLSTDKEITREEKDLNKTILTFV